MFLLHVLTNAGACARFKSHCVPSCAHTQGSELLYNDLTTRVASSLSLFEQLCKSAVFCVPVQALLPVVSSK